MKALPTLGRVVRADMYGRLEKLRREVVYEIRMLLRTSQLRKVKGHVFLRFFWCFRKFYGRRANDITAGREFILDALVEDGLIPSIKASRFSGWTDFFVGGCDIPEPGVFVQIEDHREARRIWGRLRIVYERDVASWLSRETRKEEKSSPSG